MLVFKHKIEIRFQFLLDSFLKQGKWDNNEKMSMIVKMNHMVLEFSKLSYIVCQDIQQYLFEIINGHEVSLPNFVIVSKEIEKGLIQFHTSY